MKKTIEEFTTKLKETGAYKKMQKKQLQLEEDETAGTLLNKFEKKQQECQQKQAQGQLTPGDMRELKEIRAQLTENQVFIEYQQAVGQFQEVCGQSIEKLSSLMGMDLTSYLSSGGGCC